MDFDLEDLTNFFIHRFYDQGYQDGYAHGRIHGLIEGRALGREKGYEIWEEVGHYRGFALFWNAVSNGSATESVDDKASRISRHSSVLLELITQYPLRNPPHLTSGGEQLPSSITDASQEINATAVDVETSPLDMTKIRSRYRLLCATLGVPPRLVAASTISAANGTTASLEASRMDVTTSANAELQMMYDDGLDDHPSVAAKTKKVNSIWTVNKATPDF